MLVGKWKLEVEYPGQKWELYDMEKDRTENNNLAEKYPELVNELEKEFKKWSEKVGVEDWNTIKQSMEHGSGCSTLNS